MLAAAIVIIPRLPAVAGDRVIPRSFPVAAVDRLEELDPDARVLAEYHWGGYVIYRLFDSGARVFVDGRNDMYDERILEDYVSIRNAEDGWESLLDSYGADAILLPPEAALVDGVAQDAGWCEVTGTKRLCRSSATVSVLPESTRHQRRRCRRAPILSVVEPVGEPLVDAVQDVVDLVPVKYGLWIGAKLDRIGELSDRPVPIDVRSTVDVDGILRHAQAEVAAP